VPFATPCLLIVKEKTTHHPIFKHHHTNKQTKEKAKKVKILEPRVLETLNNASTLRNKAVKRTNNNMLLFALISEHKEVHKNNKIRYRPKLSFYGKRL
jgi:hypothetical protein